MGLGKGPKQPTSPDFAAAAQQQGDANAVAGRMSGPANYQTPYGNQAVDYLPDGRAIIKQDLPPTEQAALDQQQQTDLGLSKLANQQTGNIGGILNTPFSFGGNPQTSIDTSGIAKLPVNAGTSGQAAIMSRLQPSLDRQRSSTETQLVNQGLRPGMEAYDNAIRDLGQQENDARQQAVLSGLNLDMGANAQGFGQQQAQGQFNNSGVQQQLAQALAQRDLPLNEINSLMSGSQIQNPQFNANMGGMAPAPVFQGAQAQGAFDQNVYNQKVGQSNNLMSGLFGLGGSILGGPLGAGIGKKIGSWF